MSCTYEAASAALLNTNYVTDNGQLDEQELLDEGVASLDPLDASGGDESARVRTLRARHQARICLVSHGRGPHVNLCEVCRRSLTDEMRYLKKQAEQPIPPVTPTPTPPTSLRIKGAGLFLQPTQPTQPTQPPPPRPGEQPMVRLVIGITRASNALTVRRATNVTGRYIPDYRRLGRIAYEVSEGGKPLAYGFLRGDPFQVRDYRGGSPQHEINQARTAPTSSCRSLEKPCSGSLAANRNLELKRVSRGSKRHGSRHPAAGVSGTEGQEVGNDVVAARAGRAEEDADVAARLDAHSRPVWSSRTRRSSSMSASEKPEELVFDRTRPLGLASSTIEVGQPCLQRTPMSARMGSKGTEPAGGAARASREKRSPSRAHLVQQARQTRIT